MTGIQDIPELVPITAAIIGAAMDASRHLGSGFVEKVYENALAIELERRGLKLLQREPVLVRYHDRVVGQFVTDLLVEDRVVVEIKAVSGLHRDFELQCVNYLKATGLPVCLLINFGRRSLEFRRFVRSPAP